MKKLLLAVSALATVCISEARAEADIYQENNLASLTIDLQAPQETKIAGIKWLPDYLGKNMDRTSASNGGGSNTKTCASYGNYFSECPSGTVGVGKTQPAPGVTCYKACDCNMDLFTYHKGNCTSPKLIGGTSCKKLTSATVGAQAAVIRNVSMTTPSSTPDGTFYSECGCGSDFTLSSCPNGALCQECDGKYKQTGCKSGYNRQANGTCCLNGYSNSTVCPNEKPTKIYATSECYMCVCPNDNASCTASAYPYSTPPTCARSADRCSTGCGSNLVTRYKVTEWTAGYSTDGKCTVTPCPEGQSTNKTCSTGYKLENTQYYSAGKVCKKCVQKSCSEGGYVDSCGEDYKLTGPVTYGGKTCYTGCTPKTCSEVNSSYKDSQASGESCTKVTTKAGKTCYKDCVKCATGGYVTACPAGQSGTKVDYKGLTCYKDCKPNATCATGGYVDACPTGQVGAPVTYQGKTCYKGCVNPDISVTTTAYLEDDMTYTLEVSVGSSGWSYTDDEWDAIEVFESLAASKNLAIPVKYLGATGMDYNASGYTPVGNGSKNVEIGSEERLFRYSGKDGCDQISNEEKRKQCRRQSLTNLCDGVKSNNPSQITIEGVTMNIAYVCGTCSDWDRANNKCHCGGCKNQANNYLTWYGGKEVCCPVGQPADNGFKCFYCNPDTGIGQASF